ncbi:MAG: hypothetical protein ACR2O5_00065, partial [Thiogranum sp.]
MDNKKAVRGFPAWNGIGNREVSFVFKKARGIYLMNNMIKNVIRNTLIGAVSMLAVAGVANAATVQINPADISVPLGSSFTLTVEGAGFAEATTGGGFQLTWDTAILNLTSTEADIVASLGANGFDAPALVGGVNLDANAGVLQV